MLKTAKKKSLKKSSKKLLTPKSKITTLQKRRIGKGSVDKGRLFEDSVAELYRLQGAEVIQNIEINQKKVDILATFQYPVIHRVIVECKDEKRAVGANQRVMQFHGLLDIARKTGEAESAEIITRVPWGDAAKGFAHKSGIKLLTYTEKLASLIDLTRYLKELINRFEIGDPNRPSEPPLGKYYVDLSAEVDLPEKLKGSRVKRIPVIDTYITEWIKQKNTRRQLSIFGEYGAGKSSLCQKLARNHAVSYLNNPNNSRIPILLNLRVFIGKFDMDAYITSFLDRECKVPNPKFELFKAMNDAGIFLLIFDGFDEMAIKVDADILESNLIEIEKLAVSSNSKVILTSRPEYFTTKEEEKYAISPGTGIFKNREVEYEPVRILPWDNRQVELFLRQRVPLVKEAKKPWTYYRDKIKRIGSLSDLAHRPVLLDMIVKTLPKLIESNIVINLPNLYKTYLIEEIKRQKVLKKRELLLTEVHRLALLQQLAVDFYYHSIQAITFQDALVRVEQRINPPKRELEAHTRDFLTNSFLIRRGDEYQFSHKSILEYLVANHLSEEIQAGTPEHFGRRLLQEVIMDFLKEFNVNTKTLWNWIYLTRSSKDVVGKYLGGNAAALLCVLSKDALAGKDLSRTNLTGANLSNSDLRGTNFKSATLTNAQLTSAQFLRDDLRKAKTPLKCRVSFYIDEPGIKVGPENISQVFAKVNEHSPNFHEPDYINKRYLQSIKNKEIRQAHMMYRDYWDGGPRQIKNKELIVIDTSVQNIKAINTIRDMFSTVLAVPVAVYADEFENLGFDSQDLNS